MTDPKSESQCDSHTDSRPTASTGASTDAAPTVKQTAAGHNVIQQVGSGVARIFDVDVNVSVLGGLVIGLPVLILAAVVGFVFTRSDPLLPLEGPGTKIAVAALGGDAAAGEQVGAFVASSLTSSLDADLFTVAGPSRVRDRPVVPSAAAETAFRLNADVVVYGAVTPSRGGAGAVSVDLRLAVSSQGTNESLPIVLDDPFGLPFTVVPEDLSGTDPAAVGDVRALVPFVAGVGALSAENFDRAREQFEMAAELAGTDRLRALSITMLGSTEVVAATVTRDVEPLDAAATHFETALALDDAQELARVGQVNIDYVRALDPVTFNVPDVAVMRDVIARFDSLASDVVDPFVQVTALSQATQARLAIGEPADIADARTQLVQLLDELPDLAQRPWGLFESHVQRQLGLIAFIEGDRDTAIERYTAAAEGATPFWAAFSLAAVGEIEVSRGQPCAAVEWFADAAATVGGRFPDDADGYLQRADEVGVGC